MHLRIAVLEGDGVGHEVVTQTVKCLEAVSDTFSHDFRFSKALIGKTAAAKYGNELPEETLEICANSDAILLGTLDNENKDTTPQQSLRKLRNSLGLFANIRPVKLFTSITKNSPFVKEIIEKVDFHIYHEQLAGLYNGKGTIDAGNSSANDSGTYTEQDISRITHLAFKAAKRRRKKVTLVDKANVLKTSQLWRSVVTSIASSYPDVRLQYLEIENAMVQMTLNPSHFDIVLTDAVFGDVLSGHGSVLMGVQGLLPSASIGESNCLFRPTHDALSQEKGRNRINPVSSIFSSVMLLEKFGLREESRAVFNAVRKAFDKNIVTPHLLGGRKYGTDYVGDFIVTHISDADHHNLNINDENIGLGKSTII